MSLPSSSDRWRDRLVFYPVAVVGGAFCVTVLMTIAAAFGDSRAPVTNWLNRNATSLLLWETALLVLVSVLAMGIDRLRTLRRIRRQQEQASPAGQVSEQSPGAGDSHVG